MQDEVIEVGGYEVSRAKLMAAIGPVITIIVAVAAMVGWDWTQQEIEALGVQLVDALMGLAGAVATVILFWTGVRQKFSSR